MKIQTLFAALLFASGWIFAADQPVQKLDGPEFHVKATELMEKGHAQMKTMGSAGNADVDFAALMIHHHQGAIDMATLYLKYGKDSELRLQAEKMIADQQKEISFLKSKSKTAASTSPTSPESVKERQPIPATHGSSNVHKNAK